jgi:hypothetical protein
MAAKRRSAKKVKITIDENVLVKLYEAVNALSDLARATEIAADDPQTRKRLKKAAKKRSRR